MMEDDAQAQTVANIKQLLAKCDHNVAGMPTGTHCACAAITRLMKGIRL